MSTFQLAPNLTFSQATGHLVSDMNGEKVMMSISNGKYYNLGEIGGRIWDLIATPLTLEQITERLLLEYEVEPEKCVAEVSRFIQDLLNEQLILTGEAASS